MVAAVAAVATATAAATACVFINLLPQLMCNRCVYMSISNLVRATLSARIYPAIAVWLFGCLGGSKKLHI